MLDFMLTYKYIKLLLDYRFLFIFFLLIKYDSTNINSFNCDGIDRYRKKTDKLYSKLIILRERKTIPIKIVRIKLKNIT